MDLVIEGLRWGGFEEEDLLEIKWIIFIIVGMLFVCIVEKVLLWIVLLILVFVIGVVIEVGLIWVLIELFICRIGVLWFLLCCLFCFFVMEEFFGVSE